MNLTLLATERALHEVRLVAGEELLLSLERPASSSYSAIELMSHDGLAAIYFRWGQRSIEPRSRLADVFPAVVGTVQIPVPGYGASGNPTMLLHLVSDGSPLVSLIRR